MKWNSKPWRCVLQHLFALSCLNWRLCCQRLAVGVGSWSSKSSDLYRRLSAPYDLLARVPLSRANQLGIMPRFTFTDPPMWKSNLARGTCRVLGLSRGGLLPRWNIMLLSVAAALRCSARTSAVTVEPSRFAGNMLHMYLGICLK